MPIRLDTLPSNDGSISFTLWAWLRKLFIAVKALINKTDLFIETSWEVIASAATAQIAVGDTAYGDALGEWGSSAGTFTPKFSGLYMFITDMYMDHPVSGTFQQANGAYVQLYNGATPLDILWQFPFPQGTWPSLFAPHGQSMIYYSNLTAGTAYTFKATMSTYTSGGTDVSIAGIIYITRITT